MSDRYDLYRLDVSYFCGKLEAYLRYKEIPFRCIEATRRVMAREIRPQTGIGKVPVLHTPEGLWLQDSTPIIDFLEKQHPEGAVIPTDPTQAFLSRLLEDYADEWLWRPALHYRWSFPSDSHLLGRRIANEAIDPLPLPRSWLARGVALRQQRIYVRGDGVTAATRSHVEGIYTRTLARLEVILARQSFLLGDRPSLVDFGFFASMFRHFSLDPTPSRIMRDQAPRTYAWVARLWAARHSQTKGDWPTAGHLPEGWEGLLQDAATGYLPYLHANASAWREGRRRFDWEVEGVGYRNTPVVQYRVWCRERLQVHFEALPDGIRSDLRGRLEACGAWEPLWRDGRIPSGLHSEGEPPICTPPARGRRRRPWQDAWTTWNLPGARTPTAPSN